MPNGFRLLMLLSTPFPLRPSAAIRFTGHYRQPLAALSSAAASYGRLFSEVSSSKIGFIVRSAEKVHTQAVVKEGHSDIVSPNSASKDSHAWPEWSKLVDHLLANGNSQRRVCPGDEEESFLIDAELPEAFLKAAEACLVYAKERPDILRLVTKKNLEKLVENVTPSMFRCGEMSVRRMKLFFSGQESELEKAQTIDVMRYLLSYMYKQFYASYGNQFMVDKSVETAVRKLFVELHNLRGTIWSDKSAKPSSIESPSVQEPISRPSGQGFEMKRGDWICPKCTFVNFARNMSCLECGEVRTKRQLTGAEWECPQCDFFNYGRNMSCLRCDCKRPGDVLLGSATSSGLGHSTSSNIEQIASPHEQDSIRGSSKKIGSDDSSDSISRSLDRILSRSSLSGTQSPAGVSSSDYGQSMMKQRRKLDSVPFVPLPPDMFKKAPEPSSAAAQQSSNEGVSPSPSASELIDSLLKSSESYTTSNGSKEASGTSPGWSKATVELDNAKDAANAMSDEDFPDIMPMRKGENRFVVSKKKDRSFSSPAYKRRLASEQANNYNAVPFVPFPPGYFAKKDNQPATASAENSASLEAKAEDGEEQKVEMSNRAVTGSSPAHSEGRIYGKNLNQGNVSMDYGPSSGYSFQQTQRSNAFDAKKFGENLSDSSYGSGYSTHPASNLGKYGGLASNSNTSQPSRPQGGYSAGSAQQSDNLWNNNGRYDGEFGPVSARPRAIARNDSTSRSSINSWNSDNLSGGGGGGGPCLPNNASLDLQNGQNNQNGGYSGKSLEGSLVKEPDPLDMSEEAKAERWFRRAAQIKDISELSQIPDEDFPEIMPMRKGVNRFVVSKRKTPLERRLTSPQYRRHLPTVSSELDNDANN